MSVKKLPVKVAKGVRVQGPRPVKWVWRKRGDRWVREVQSVKPAPVRPEPAAFGSSEDEPQFVTEYQTQTEASTPWDLHVDPRHF